MRKVLTIGATVALLVVSARAQNGPWVAAYWPGWEFGDGHSNLSPPYSAINWGAFTEIMYFSMVPKSNGGLDSSLNGMVASAARRLIDSAHTHNVKVLFTIGGVGTEAQFLSATSSANIETFVTNLATYTTTVGFDGIDIDWEALNTDDSSNFRMLAEGLRLALGSNIILTNTGGNPEVNAETAQYFDQVNIDTYDLSGNYPGWITWFNGSPYTWGPASSNGQEQYASCETSLNRYINAGVPISKLGIGSEFGGTIWKGGIVTDSAGVSEPGTNGVTAPNEAYSTSPTMSYDVPLYWSDGSGIMQKYYQPQYYRWDSTAQAPYLSIDSAGSNHDYFISYDDTNAIKAKLDYITSKGIGGIVLWTLKMGYPGNGKYPALNVIANILHPPSTGVRTQPTAEIPTTPTLEQNYPNPFNPSTALKFTLPNRSHIRLMVYNVLGQLVSILADGEMSQGTHSIEWNGDRFSSGLYFCVLQAGGHKSVTKMELLK